MINTSSIELYQLEDNLTTFWQAVEEDDAWSRMGLYLVGLKHAAAIAEDQQLVEEIRCLIQVAARRCTMSFNR